MPKRRPGPARSPDSPMFAAIRNEIATMAAEDGKRDPDMPSVRRLLLLASVKGHSAPARLALYLLFLMRDPKRLHDLTVVQDCLRQAVRILADMAERGVSLIDYETFVRRLRELELGPEQLPNLVVERRSPKLDGFLAGATSGGDPVVDICHECLHRLQQTPGIVIQNTGRVPGPVCELCGRRRPVLQVRYEIRSGGEEDG